MHCCLLLVVSTPCILWSHHHFYHFTKGRYWLLRCGHHIPSSKTFEMDSYLLLLKKCKVMASFLEHFALLVPPFRPPCLRRAKSGEETLSRRWRPATVIRNKNPEDLSGCCLSCIGCLTRFKCYRDLTYVLLASLMIHHDQMTYYTYINQYIFYSHYKEVIIFSIVLYCCLHNSAFA